MNFDDPETRWTIIHPGVLGLPTTSLRITFRPGSAIPWVVTHGETQIYDGLAFTLKDAKEKAAAFARELAEVGLEP